MGSCIATGTTVSMVHTAALVTDDDGVRWRAIGSHVAPASVESKRLRRRYHVCFGTDGNLMFSEIWDSREQWEAFVERLMPVLADAGIEFSGEPEVFEIHDITRR